MSTRRDFMRKLAWTTLGFGIACVICAYFLPSWIPLTAVIAPVIGILVLAGKKYFRFLRVITAVTIGFSLGVAWFAGYDFFYLENAREMDGCTSSEQLEVCGYSYQTDYGYAVDVRYTRNGKNYRAIAYLQEDPSAVPGDTMQGDFRFRFTAHGGDKAPAYRRGSGFFLTLQQKGEVSIRRADEIPSRYYPSVLNKWILKRIEDNFPADTVAFAKGLLLGDRVELGYEEDTAFRLSGISHIVAVSGLHVGILIGFLFFLTGKRRFLTSILGIPMLLLFAAIVGFKPSVNRACMMQSLLLISMAVDREYDGITALSFSALVLMLLNPMVVIDIGFQLSFASVMGIFLFSSQIHNWFVSRKWMGVVKGKALKFRLKRWFIGSVSVSVSASVLTTPLVAYYFGAVSLLSVLTNLLILWAVPLIFYGIIVTVAFSFFAGPVSAVVALPTAVLIRYVMTVARMIAKVPYGAVFTADFYSVIWLFLAYALILTFLMLHKKSVPTLIGSLAVSLLFCNLLSFAEPRLDDCRMTMLDVGQGQCLIFSWDGKTYMVDCGGSYDSTTANLAAETLLSQGIFKIDGFILTHFDSDHFAGLPLLLTRLRVDQIYYPDVAETGEVKEKLELAFDVSGVTVSSRMEIRTQHGILELLPALASKTDNESSLSILFRHEKCAILVTDDQDTLGELLLIKNYDLPKVDVLVAGHHGSGSSTGEQLLRTVCPDIVLISVGKNNSYHLPSQDLLQRLQSYECAVYRTDESGTIIFRR